MVEPANALLTGREGRNGQQCPKRRQPT
jgi:hypothetical protein